MTVLVSGSGYRQKQAVNESHPMTMALLAMRFGAKKPESRNEGFSPSLSRLKENAPKPLPEDPQAKAKKELLSWLWDKSHLGISRGKVLEAISAYSRKFNLLQCHANMVTQLHAWLSDAKTNASEPLNRGLFQFEARWSALREDFLGKKLVAKKVGGRFKACDNCSKLVLTPTGEEALKTFKADVAYRKANGLGDPVPPEVKAPDLKSPPATKAEASQPARVSPLSLHKTPSPPVVRHRGPK